jgi:hypothetical protein
MGNHEGKLPFTRPRHRCNDKVKLDRKDTGWKGVDWIHLSLDRSRWLAVVDKAVYLLVILSAENLLTGPVAVGFDGFCCVGLGTKASTLSR